MDNFHFDITSEGEAALRHALSVALTGKWGVTKVVGWQEDPKKGLILFKYASTKSAMVPFLIELGIDELVPLIKTWLENQDYGPEPDHDGSNGKGFRIYNEDWGRIGDDWSTICAIKPNWAWYGK